MTDEVNRVAEFPLTFVTWWRSNSEGNKTFHVSNILSRILHEIKESEMSSESRELTELFEGPELQ